ASFIPVSTNHVGLDLFKPIVGRGSAYADFDQDGDLDVVLCQTGGAPLFCRNDQSLQHNWLKVQLTGKKSNRSAIGATINLKSAGQLQSRQVMPTRSYLSQCELPVTFGLGKATSVDELVIRWPSGKIQPVTVPSLNRSIHVTEAD
ncbi:MAG: ASPIC/UnbV domain-containing protein, partial [Verrucomicrobiota bacterium]|nr:ASPIC/UnbV domain-containing protein [Verrucomicrobiota bacterium]